MSDNYGKITLGATGDILLHKRVYNKAKQEDGTYNFDEMFSNVESLFKKDHLIIVNQESIIAGKELGLSCFPKFNSPVEIGYKLKDMNVDIVNIANNHTMDHGEKGVLKSIENWEKIGLPYVGAYKSREDQETLRIIHKNGLRICFLSYTGVSFGQKVPERKGYLLNRYGKTTYAGFKGAPGLRRLINRIKREDLADVFVVSIHYGKEYHMFPTALQKEIAIDLADAGADIIIGHHPHVLQPPASLMNSKGETSFASYSLGNFFSGQKGLYRQIGGYMTIDIEKPLEGRLLKVTNPTFTLTYVDSDDASDYKIHLLKDIVKSQKTIKTNIGEFDAKMIYEKMITHMKKWVPELDVN